MFENIRLSFRGIWAHKMRSFLTMLGIIIGIAAIIAIVSTIKGTNEQIKQNLVGAGENTVEISLYQGEWEYEMEYNGIPEGVPLVADEVVEQLKEIPHVENVSRYLSRQDYNGVYHLNTGLSGGYVKGVDTAYFDTCNYIMKEGRGFTQQDFDQYHKVAILDEDSADALFQGEEAVGETIEIQQEPYVVVGIVTKAKKFEPVINSIDDYYTYAQDSAGSVYVPATTWPIIYQYDEPQNVVLRVESTDDMTSAGKAGADLLSVTERTQEIGLKKAIGARKSRILGQFLTEAAVLTSLGGLIGVLVGIILAQVISYVTTTPVAISVPAAVGAVAFSMVIGIVFGVFPSYKAANLNPIDALRHE